MTGLIPENISDFYLPSEGRYLAQGDIIDSSEIGLKKAPPAISPDFWMIITKTCDLVIESTGVVRKKHISLIPIFSLRTLFKRWGVFPSTARELPRIVLVAIRKLHPSTNIQAMPTVCVNMNDEGFARTTRTTIDERYDTIENRKRLESKLKNLINKRENK